MHSSSCQSTEREVKDSLCSKSRLVPNALVIVCLISPAWPIRLGLSICTTMRCLTGFGEIQWRAGSPLANIDRPRARARQSGGYQRFVYPMSPTGLPNPTLGAGILSLVKYSAPAFVYPINNCDLMWKTTPASTGAKPRINSSLVTLIC